MFTPSCNDIGIGTPNILGLYISSLCSWLVVRRALGPSYDITLQCPTMGEGRWAKKMPPRNTLGLSPLSFCYNLITIHWQCTKTAGVYGQLIPPEYGHWWVLTHPEIRNAQPRTYPIAPSPWFATTGPTSVEGSCAQRCYHRWPWRNSSVIYPAITCHR